MNDEARAWGRRTLLKSSVAGTAAAATAAALGAGSAQALAPGAPMGAAEGRPGRSLEVARWLRTDRMPTGVTVSRKGRIFVCQPTYDTVHHDVTLSEVMPDGRLRPYPSRSVNTYDPERPAETLWYVLNCVVDPSDHLWLLDAGLVAIGGPPVDPQAAKLVCIDLATDRIVRVVPLAAGVTPQSSLNDLRIASPGGTARFAYITDTGRSGQGAIVAVDLETGRVERRLASHPSTGSVPGGVMRIIEGSQFLFRFADGTTAPQLGGANAIALSPDGRRLYYGPFASRRLYSVDTAALLDPDLDDDAVAETVVDLGDKGSTAGIIADSKDRVYLTMQEFNGIARRELDGTITMLDRDPRLSWPDTLWITDSGWLYVTAAQGHLLPFYNKEGENRQQPPFALMRMRIDAGPVWG